MSLNNIRPYELSLWTLQDGFITVLKSINANHRGQIETPKCQIKNDGTQELNFSVPMYYRNENGIMIENPIWYDIQQGSLLVNLRKLKLIFNKGEKGEEVFEFVINKITETHSEGQLVCEVSAESLAFQELGKVGYKISLSSEDYLDEYNKWYDSTVGKNTEDKKFDYPSEEAKKKAEPINNLNYWCEKVFKGSNWEYSIQMDWSSFDGRTDLTDNEAREKQGLRRTDKIYEEEYIASWEDNGEQMVPSRMEGFKEKTRQVDFDKSNKYNLTQNLAETFGVHCRYKYHYDENYHIVKRECIFYNNFLEEENGKIDITYPYSTSKIEREIESADLVTKLFVTPVESETAPSGLVTIADVSANRSREDYILNFDYMYNIGTISQEQYDAITDYERTMFIMNQELEPISQQIAEAQDSLVKQKAKETTAKNGQKEAKDQMDQASDSISAITTNGYLYQNLDNPYRATLITEEGKTDSYYIKITREGVDYNGTQTYPLYADKKDEAQGVKIYYNKKVGSEGNTEVAEYGDLGKEVKFNLDSNGNLETISGLIFKEDAASKIYYATFAYKPQLHYQNIYDTYAKKLADDEAAEKAAAAEIKRLEKKIETLEEKQETLLEEKAKKTTDFENMMGPALKEGSWQAENYTDYGSKFTTNIQIGSGINSESIINFIWDDIAFDEEQLLSYEDGVNLDTKYYTCVYLSGISSSNALWENLDKISFVYTINSKEHYMTIGSEACYAFIRNNTSKEIKPVLILLDKNFDKAQVDKDSAFIGLISSKVNGKNIEVTKTKFAELTENSYVPNLDTDWTLVYPRFEVKTLLLKDSEDELILKETTKDYTLKKYYDYSVLVRKDSYYITLNTQTLLSGGSYNTKKYDIAYTISNAAEALYLDALEVSKTNAFPQVSYTVEISALNKEFMKYAYQQLNRIVNINDAELKFNDVQGYISELELNLDSPWEDSVTIQNYKTKFEDLFSTIVASSEQMKTNSFAYNTAASAFTSGGSLRQSAMQSSINTLDLTYAFNQGALTIDEENGIWATSKDGVVAMRGGGIFCATRKDPAGNWLWNTGIMPSGINASLITAGQIDTNLIKIYAGDNLRLQLNADGLFAYRKNNDNEAILNNYVVHNSEGLFLVEPKKDSTEAELINKVEISWEGLILRNNNNEKVFFADNSGNLTLTGTITAKEGYIGNWKITDTGLQTVDGTAGIHAYVTLDNDGKPVYGTSNEPMIWVTGINDNEFRVTKDGTLYCSDAIIKGTVSAGSFIGNSSTEDVDKQLRNISIAILDGSSYSFSNKNYDGIITINPEVLKFRIYTNALTDEELEIPGEIEKNTGYSFWIGTDETNMIELVSPTLEKVLIWEPNYLTFRVMSDIMYLGVDKNEKPNTLLYFKVEKKGRERVIENGEIEYKEEPHTYSSTILLSSELFGLDKYISPISPSSYTFVEDKATGNIIGDNTVVFSVNATGFTKEELSKGQWYINNEAQEKITITGNDEKKEHIISFTVSSEQITNGSINISFKIDFASRECYCFKTQNAVDAVTISLMSSSGDTLASGDIETELSTIVRYGAQVANENARGKFFYVWKKDGVALSSFTDKCLVNGKTQNGEPYKQEIYYEVFQPEILNRDKIWVDVNDFGVKSKYECHVFTTLEEAGKEYLLSNENKETSYDNDGFYFTKQLLPEEGIGELGQKNFKVTIEVSKPEEVEEYTWYYKNRNMSKFVASDSLKTNSYNLGTFEDSDTNLRVGRAIYCEVKFKNKDKTIKSNVIVLKLKEE